MVCGLAAANRDYLMDASLKDNWPNEVHRPVVLLFVPHTQPSQSHATSLHTQASPQRHHRSASLTSCRAGKPSTPQLMGCRLFVSLQGTAWTVACRGPHRGQALWQLTNETQNSLAAANLSISRQKENIEKGTHACMNQNLWRLWLLHQPTRASRHRRSQRFSTTPLTSDGTTVHLHRSSSGFLTPVTVFHYGAAGWLLPFF